MVSLDYILCVAAGFFSIFLIAWYGYNAPHADWVFGFLAVMWSLIMMMRLITLTTSSIVSDTHNTLSQKILKNFHEKQHAIKLGILQKSLGGSFGLFLAFVMVFTLWQIMCQVFPEQGAFLASIKNSILKMDIDMSWAFHNAYHWGQFFMLALSVCMMAFVVRSNSANLFATRPLMIVFASYAVAGFITLAGLYDGMSAQNTSNFSLFGSGLGSSFLLSAQNYYGHEIPTFFDILLIEGGIIGLGIITFLVFVPLGSVCLNVQTIKIDPLVLICAMIVGIALILSIFLAFSPAVAGFMFLCIFGLFWAWGASDVTVFEKISYAKA